MARVLAAVVVLVLGAGTLTRTPSPPPAADQATALPADEVEQRIVAATDRVVAFGCGLASNSGSAVVLAGGAVLTNRHVVDGAVLINVVPELGRTAVARGRVSPSADLALLDLPTTGRRGLPLAGSDPEEGAAVYVAGYVEGDLGLTVHPTELVDYADGAARGHAGDVMRVDYRARVGMSGGPVVDEAGQVVGLIYAVERSTGYGLAIPASDIGDQLELSPFGPAAGCPAVAPAIPARLPASPVR